MKNTIKKILSEETTSDLKNDIESFLLDNFPLIVTLSFSSPYVVGLGSSFDEETGKMKTIYRTSIYITLDPRKILEGSEGFDPMNKFIRYDYDPKSYIREIRKALKNYFGIDVFDYGSKWEVRGYTLEIEAI
jgi:hypothetical protein